MHGSGIQREAACNELGCERDGARTPLSVPGIDAGVEPRELPRYLAIDGAARARWVRGDDRRVDAENGRPAVGVSCDPGQDLRVGSEDSRVGDLEAAGAGGSQGY